MKKVLILTYYWPPAGGPGVQRWLKFVKYFREFGIEPVVYVPENPTYPIRDASLLAEIPEDIEVIKRHIFEPYAFAGLLSKKDAKSMSSGIISEEKEQSLLQKSLLYIRGNFFLPDARKFWIKPSVKFLTEYLSKENIDTIITTGPPHSLHLIGLGLKQKIGLRWIADFRDPWTSIGYQEKLKLSKSSKKKHREMEALVLQSADQILTTSFLTKKEFQKHTKKPIEVITNGFDEEEAPMGRLLLDTEFSLSHIGSLLSGRNPRNLWEVFSELINENKIFDQCFRLQLIGEVSRDVLQSIKDCGLEDHVNLIGYVSHKEALRYLEKSQLLLLLEIDSPQTRGIIPGKLFEYMFSKRPILGIGPHDWEAKEIIRQTDTGSCFGYEEKEALKLQITDYFSAYQRAELRVKPEGIEQYSRRELTRKLSEVILRGNEHFPIKSN